jgi:hypothetical protein
MQNFDLSKPKAEAEARVQIINAYAHTSNPILEGRINAL